MTFKKKIALFLLALTMMFGFSGAQYIADDVAIDDAPPVWVDGGDPCCG